MEESRVRFLRQLLTHYNCRLVVMRLLHHVVSGHHETGLDIAVGINHSTEGYSELVYIYILETIYVRYIILCGVAVFLPFQINATLVLTQRIKLLLGVRLQHNPTAIGTSV